MNQPDDRLGLYAQLACIWEATARKPGNVHRFHDFTDTTYLDFLTSASAVAPVLAAAPANAVGFTVARAVHATREVSAGNTNLGIVLLLAPLAKARPDPDFRANVLGVLRDLTLDDASLVYGAIRSARAGGLGEAAEQDVRAAPKAGLREAMALAADRDLIARQYANGFAEVFEDGAGAILAGISSTGCLEGAIIHAHLYLMSRHPDTLIQRKRGPEEAREAAARAEDVLSRGWPDREEGRRALEDLDAWLRAEGNRRNPGTTADLIAASLFVLLRQGRLSLPLTLPWGLGSAPG
jgi:triphosphoribosyl-dephospho-CoA synthase